MNKIWEILNIEPTKDKAAIKRAYALLARQYNPEDEPEKYQELHEAYKQALFLADHTGIEIHRLDEPEDTQQAKPSEDDGNVAFDFSTVEEDYLPENNLAETIIEDIISLRESNCLNSRAELELLSHPMKEALSMRMLTMYRFLALTTNDITVWDSFFNEPLIKYCMDFEAFRYTVVEQLEDNPSHQEAVQKIISEFEEAPGSARIIAEKKGFSLSREKKLKGLAIIIVAWALQFVSYGIVTGLMIKLPPYVEVIAAASLLLGVIAICVYTIVIFSKQSINKE